MAGVKQGQFEIDCSGKITIGQDQAGSNKVTISVVNTGPDDASVWVSVRASFGTDPDDLVHSPDVFGNDPDDLLHFPDVKPVAVATVAGDTSRYELTKSADTDARLCWWRSGQLRSVPVKAGQTLSIELSGFRSCTPPGRARLGVLLQQQQPAQNPDAAPTRTPNDVEANYSFVDVEKVAVVDAANKPTLHYFTVSPEYLLQRAERVDVGFYATGFSSVSLFRNVQSVQDWPPDPKNPQGIRGQWTDRPSITTVYRLEGRPGAQGAEAQQFYRTVQVINAGWNRLALPHGYPAQLFVHKDFVSGGPERLYGIFIDKPHPGDTQPRAALWSSATGVDAWRREPGPEFGTPGALPPHMATSPGVAFDDKLWLIGGSSSNESEPGSEVWCYERKDPDDQSDTTREWKKQPALALLGAKDKDGKPTSPEPRMGHACLVAPRKDAADELWLIGGWDERNNLKFNDVWRLVPAVGDKAARWEPICAQSPASSQRWAGRHMHGAAAMPPYEKGKVSVWIFGGRVRDQRGDRGTSDVWRTDDGVTWTQLPAFAPPQGDALGSALMTFYSRHPGDRPRLLLLGTFLLPKANDTPGNVTTSRIFEWGPGQEVWEMRDLGEGWETFFGAWFSMQALSFNGFVFVWSLYPKIDPEAPPKLNILVPS